MRSFILFGLAILLGACAANTGARYETARRSCEAIPLPFDAEKMKDAAYFNAYRRSLRAEQDCFNRVTARAEQQDQEQRALQNIGASLQASGQAFVTTNSQASMPPGPPQPIPVGTYDPGYLHQAKPIRPAWCPPNPAVVFAACPAP